MRVKRLQAAAVQLRFTASSRSSGTTQRTPRLRPAAHLCAGGVSAAAAAADAGERVAGRGPARGRGLPALAGAVRGAQGKGAGGDGLLWIVVRQVHGVDAQVPAAKKRMMAS